MGQPIYYQLCADITLYQKLWKWYENAPRKKLSKPNATGCEDVSRGSSKRFLNLAAMKECISIVEHETFSSKPKHKRIRTQ